MKKSWLTTLGLGAVLFVGTAFAVQQMGGLQGNCGRMGGMGMGYQPSFAEFRKMRQGSRPGQENE